MQKTIKKSIKVFKISTLFVLMLLSACAKGTKKEERGSYKKSFSHISLGELEWEMYQSTNPSIIYKAKVPGTVLGALVEKGVFGDVFKSKNLEKVPDSLFNSSWVYETSFELNEAQQTKNGVLKFEGLNYKANIWVNDVLVADTSEALGVFSTFDFGVSSLQQSNSLKVEVFAPKAGDFTMGFVDWAPVPQDKNMGIWRPVTLELVDKIDVANSFIRSKLNVETLDTATLFVSTELNNLSQDEITASVQVEIEGIKITKDIRLKADESKKVIFNPADFKALGIKNPRIWWPHTYGDPEMYQAKVSVITKGMIADEQLVDFGIRDVKDYFTEEGYRGYVVNGKPIMIKGGGWVDDLFLNNSTEYNQAQLDYCKEMGLNVVRFEGFWGTSQEIYDMCDKEGLLAMVGFSCQWEWNEYIGGEHFEDCDDCVGGAITTDEEIELVAAYFTDMVKWLRNHPSVFLWTGGSDRLHPQKLEKKYLSVIKEENTGALFCGAAKSHVSPVTGPTGVKMYGPYDYVPPVYWYTDTARGGAYGFNTETGPGPQPPVLNSVKQMLAEDEMWPLENEAWKYHNGRHAFETMEKYLTPLKARYKEPTTIEEFCYIAQVQNYELMRPMFEAFVVNKPKATGVVQWMLNSAWPETYWQLYDYYLRPTGAYYGVKKANEPLSVVYNYGDDNIYVSNESLVSEELSVKCVIYDEKSDSVTTLTDEVSVKPYVTSLSTRLNLSKFVSEQKGTFVKLYLYKGETLVQDNFYWLSSKRDVMEPDYEKSSWIYTPTSQHADFSYLYDVPATQVEISIEQEKEVDGQKVVTYKVTNKGVSIALFVELDLEKEVLPVFWSDNYFSLLPSESKIINLKVSADKYITNEINLNWLNK